MSSFARTPAHRSRRTGVLRRVLVAFVALALVGAACGDDDGGGSADDTTTTTLAPSDGDTGDTGDTGDEDLTASYKGVTADSVKLGVALIDFAGLLEFGVDLDAGPIVEEWPAWAAAQNERGGINGRRIDAVIEQFLPVGNETSLAACVNLTEDEEVFAVAGQLFGDNPLCFTEDHETPYLGLFGLTPELAERSIAPFLTTEMSADLQRENSAQIFIDEGFGEGKKVGVHYPAAEADIVESLVLPLLEDAGIDVVATSVAEDFGTDAQAANDAMDINIERLRDADVEVLITTSGVTGIMGPLQRNDFSPQVVFFNGQATDGGQFEGAGVDPSYLEDALAITANKPTFEELLADDLVEACVDDYNASGPAEPLVMEDMTLSQLRGTATNCAGFRMFVLLAEAAGADLTPDSLVAAAEGYGPIELPGMPGATLGPDKHSAGNALRLYEYDPVTNEMTPTSDPIIVG